MNNWGFILWLLGLSVMTLVSVMWLLDISGRQRKLQKRIESIFTDEEGQDLSQPLEALAVPLQRAPPFTNHVRYQEVGNPKYQNPFKMP